MHVITSMLFFNKFKIDSDATKSYPKSLLEVIKVTDDGHCILHAMREAMRHENVKAIPSNSELLIMIKFEVLNNLDYYSKFINSADVIRALCRSEKLWI